MSLVPSFVDLVQPLACVMTAPTFDSFLTVLTDWTFTRRRTVTGMILAADAVGTKAKHHGAYHRVFAAARPLEPGRVGAGGVRPDPAPGRQDGAAGVDDTLSGGRKPQAFYCTCTDDTA